MRLKQLASVLLLIAGLFCCPSVLPAVEGYPAHYIVFSLDAEGDITPVFHRAVLLASPHASRSEEELESLRSLPARGEESLDIEVLDAGGDVIFRDLMSLPSWIRGEFHGSQEVKGGWKIDGHLFPQKDRAFVVRIPWQGGETLSLSMGGATRMRQKTASFSLSDLVAREDLLALPDPPSGKVRMAESAISGSPGNRVDLLFLGDGYTAAQAAKFQADVASLDASFFGLVPYSTYRNYVNRVYLFTPSAQSGADHPPYNPSCPTDDPSCCADPIASVDPLAGTYVSTALGARYCSFNIYRLLVVDSSAVFAAASAYPDWDRVMVLVNDPTYGGSGGFFSVVSTSPAAVDVARHEYGHSFTGLADEYDSAYPGYPACSDISGPACEANVTDRTSRATVKWAPWIAITTPVPTPEASGYDNMAGLFQGARYQAGGMYRHRDTSCLMNFLGVGFGEVCSQEYILQLYRGNWGSPADGIDLIEPGTERPSPGSYTALTGAHLSAGLLAPVGGLPPQVTWKINGTAVPGALGSSFLFNPGAAGTYEVSLEARDPTSLVHPSMVGTLLQSSRSWFLTIAPSPATSFYTLSPCRVFDTRNPIGPFGGPVLAPGTSRSFELAGRCGVPATARAIVGNLTIVQPAQAGHLVTFAGDSPPPLTSSINFAAGQVRSNNITLALAQNGLGTVTVESGTGGTVHVMLDVTGYYQ